MKRWQVVGFSGAIVACAFVFVLLLSHSPYTNRDQNLGTLPSDAPAVTHTVTFRNPSYLLNLAVTPPPATGCACVRVVTPAQVIAPRQSATFRVAIEPSEAGKRTEALHFTARQGFTTKPVYVFLTYRVAPVPLPRKPLP